MLPPFPVAGSSFPVSAAIRSAATTAASTSRTPAAETRLGVSSLRRDGTASSTLVASPCEVPLRATSTSSAPSRSASIAIMSG